MPHRTFIKPVEVWQFPFPAIVNDKYNTDSIISLIHESVAIQWQYPDSALKFLNQACYESIVIGNFNLTGRAQTNMGLAAMSKGDFDACFKHFNIAYKYIQLAGTQKEELPSLYISIGTSYYYQDNYQKAFEYYYAILQFMMQEAPDNSNLVMANNNIADVLMHMGQYDKATYYLNQAEHLIKITKAENILSYLVSTKADLAFRTNQLDACIKLCNQALALAKKYGNKDAEQSIYIVKANYFLKKNQPRTAIQYLNNALENNDGVYPFLSLIAPYYTLGFAYYQAQDYEQSEKALLKALKMAEKLKINADKINALNMLSLIYENTGRYKEALYQRKAYNSLKDSIQDMEKRTLANELEVKYRTAQKDKNIIQKQLLIEKQDRDIDNKNTWLICIALSLFLLVLISGIVYVNFKNKNKIAMLKAKLEGEELERSRIAADLHDGVGGMLAVVKMRLTSGLKTEQEKRELIDLLNATSTQVRTTSHNLMPNVVTDFTLREALTQYIDNINHGQSILKISLQIYATLNLTNLSARLSIYRMIQEAIQNIVKHAKATEATIQIFDQPNKLHILIEDNGIGFNIDKIKKGLGLINLENRVKLMNGKIHIDSTPGSGTTLNLELEI